MADTNSLDLVEISPNAEPPVCKVMDYGKFLFEKSKALKEQKKKQKIVLALPITIEWFSFFKILLNILDCWNFKNCIGQKCGLSCVKNFSSSLKLKGLRCFFALERLPLETYLTTLTA